MKNKRAVILGSLICLLCISQILALPGYGSEVFHFGVNGHPLNQVAYSGSIDTQLDLIKRAGMDYYRLDVQVDTATGIATNESRLIELITKANVRDIKLLIMLYSAENYAASDTSNYNNGKLRGTNFINRYKNYAGFDAVVKVIELGNELELKCIKPNYWGTLASHYDATKSGSIASNLKGMNDGIKSIKPAIKTLVNVAGSSHYGFFSMLINKGVGFDIIGYHWYSSESHNADITNALYADGGLRQNILNTVGGLFGKDIWITEVNRCNGDLNETTGDTQPYWLERYVSEMCYNTYVKAFMVYELYDESNQLGGEAHYGLITSTGVPKASYNTMRYQIEQVLNGNEDYVYAMYQKCDGIIPDANSLAYWVSFLRDTCAGNLSAYFDTWYPIDNYPSFVKAQYLNLFDHPIDSIDNTALNYFVGYMQSGATREDLINVFCCSDEFYIRSGSTNAGFVNRYYVKLLGRSPDAAGFNSWVARLNAGTAKWTVIDACLHSDEYYENFIGATYLQFLGRNPEADGLTYFKALMQQGTTQLEVIKAVCIGNEFWTDAVSAGLLRRNP